MKQFMTVKSADLFSVKLDRVISQVEMSHALMVAIVFEDENIKVINAIGKVEHESLEAAKAYRDDINESVSNALHDELQLRKEQGV